MRLFLTPGDEGPLRTARQALADRFRFWRGVSGRRYVCSVFPAEAAPAYAPAVALYVRRDPNGLSVIAVEAASERPYPPDADEVHIHLVSDERDLHQALSDLAALVPAPARRAA